MFTVALIGPDGAGKTTIGREVETTLSIPVKYVYMGINLDSSSLVLPTTRLLLEIKRAMGRRPDLAGPPDPNRIKPRPKNIIRRILDDLKSSLRLASRLSEEWFRQFVVWFYQRRGYIVLFDRHFFFDYYFYHVEDNGSERRLGDRIHGYVLDRFYPHPDLVICLDAPAEVLFGRKGEGTVELLERRRREYLRLRDVVGNFVIIDASRPKDEVLHGVSAEILKFYHQRNAKSRKEENHQIYA
jgi:thymidylate kinase